MSLLVLLIADDKAIVPAIGVQPFLLGRTQEDGIGNGDIKREAELVLAGAGIGHGLARGGDGAWRWLKPWAISIRPPSR